MSSEPSYPKDATVTDASSTPLNETLDVAVSAKATQANVEGSKGSTRSFVRGAAVGVGSAAVVAALLYANRSRRGDKHEPTTTPTAVTTPDGTLPAPRSDSTGHPDS